MSNSAEKDVEQLLLAGRRRARNSGAPYPVDVRHKDILNFDNWNNMFLKSCCKGLTMYQFKSPPSRVLDLGCGSGFWALEAARNWPASTIIGFDLQNFQPDLLRLGALEDLASRVRWIHGNLLDGLPFESDHFDFVRIVNIGLGVPEDEWQTVLEEVCRVMKPGAILEIIEEDLVFPYHPYARNRPRPPPITVDFPRVDSLPSSTISVMTSTTLPSSDYSFDEALESLSKQQPLLFPSPESPPSTFQPFHPRRSTHSLTKSPPPPVIISQDYGEEFEHESHPQDHSRLKSAWDCMLANRFMNSSITTVLPFYLSTCFVDVQSHSPLRIPLPPNSPTSASSRLSDQSDWYADNQFALAPYSGRKSHDVAKSRVRSESKFSMNNSMHLAKAVVTVSACKEAIWDAYKTLYGPELPPVTRTARPTHAASQAASSSAREGFDRAWSNWESDMKDRIGFRHSLAAEFNWSEPPGERPDWRVWRDNIDLLATKKHTTKSGQQSQALCRSLRGFVAWKPQ